MASDGTFNGLTLDDLVNVGVAHNQHANGKEVTVPLRGAKAKSEDMGEELGATSRRLNEQARQLATSPTGKAALTEEVVRLKRSVYESLKQRASSSAGKGGGGLLEDLNDRVARVETKLDRILKALTE